MTDDTMSRVMFWVGLMFVATPMLVVAVVVLTRRYLHRKGTPAKSQGRPS